MEKRREQQEPPDNSAVQRTPKELVMLIRKLRWMGMEDEAKTLENWLILNKLPATDSVVAASRETD